MVQLAKEEPDPVKKERILQFESYIDNVLTVELQKHHKNFHLKEANLEEWMQLKRMIAAMTERNLPGFKGNMHLGSGVHVAVEVPDISKMIMNLGSGVFVEMNMEDASIHIENQIFVLERELIQINEQMTGLKARIQVVAQRINDLDMNTAR